jgi:hypothetical protein
VETLSNDVSPYAAITRIVNAVDRTFERLGHIPGRRWNHQVFIGSEATSDPDSLERRIALQLRDRLVLPEHVIRDLYVGAGVKPGHHEAFQRAVYEVTRRVAAMEYHGVADDIGPAQEAMTKGLGDSFAALHTQSITGEIRTEEANLSSQNLEGAMATEYLLFRTDPTPEQAAVESVIGGHGIMLAMDVAHLLHKNPDHRFAAAVECVATPELRARELESSRRESITPTATEIAAAAEKMRTTFGEVARAAGSDNPLPTCEALGGTARQSVMNLLDSKQLEGMTTKPPQDMKAAQAALTGQRPLGRSGAGSTTQAKSPAEPADKGWRGGVRGLRGKMRSNPEK